jgi:hypothetical protein
MLRDILVPIEGNADPLWYLHQRNVSIRNFDLVSGNICKNPLLVPLISDMYSKYVIGFQY